MNKIQNKQLSYLYFVTIFLQVVRQARTNIPSREKNQKMSKNGLPHTYRKLLLRRIHLGAAGTVIFPDRIDFSGQINIFCCKILSFPGVPDFCCADPNSSILLRGPPTRRFCCKTQYYPTQAQIPATRNSRNQLPTYLPYLKPLETKGTTTDHHAHQTAHEPT